MGRFDDRAIRLPGPGAALRWKVFDPLRGMGRRPAGDGKPEVVRPDREAIDGGKAQLTWLGHASFVFTLGGLRFLVDPVLGRGIGPVRRLVAPGIAVEDLPPIDVVLVTHAHRDHADLWTLSRVPGAPRFVVPLGMTSLVRGFARREVHELDWWESIDLGGAVVTFVPAQHWSMRVPWDRNDMLWGGFVVRGPEGSIYHSGDTGWFDGFAEIGQRAGPIDWAMLPIGAYEPRWFMHRQHMGPDDATRAAQALGAKNFVAMHWGTFRLTDEPVGEPPALAREHWSGAGGDPERLWILGIGETRRLG